MKFALMPGILGRRWWIGLSAMAPLSAQGAIPSFQQSPSWSTYLPQIAAVLAIIGALVGAGIKACSWIKKAIVRIVEQDAANRESAKLVTKEKLLAHLGDQVAWHAASLDSVTNAFQYLGRMSPGAPTEKGAPNAFSASNS